MDGLLWIPILNLFEARQPCQGKKPKPFPELLRTDSTISVKFIVHTKPLQTNLISEVDFLCSEHVRRENVLTAQAYSSLMTDLNWSLRDKRNSLVMPQLSLIAMSNFKAIQDENCLLGSKREEESGASDERLVHMLSLVE